jgi:meiotic recombination protein DMC1
MQTEQLESLAQNFATNEYRLLIIDSVMSLYRTDYIGRGELSERQQVLGGFLRRATQMAEEFNLVVLMVCCWLSLLHSSYLTELSRPIKSCRIPVRVLCLQGLMVANQLEDTFSPMLLQLDFSFARAVVRNVLLRLWIHLVSALLNVWIESLTDAASDCPEREATYIITTGGINDPEKA